MFNEFESGDFDDSAEDLISNQAEIHSSTPEAELLADVSDSRRAEMKKYGRAEAFEQIADYLQGDVRVAFALVNYVPAFLDDDIDTKGSPERLSEAKAILSESFDGGHGDVHSDTWRKRVVELGEVLAKLREDGFDGAEKVFDEVENFWSIEEQNLARRDMTLTAEELEKLNMNIGKSVGLQFLHLLTPELDEDSKETIAEAYGLAIKLADNLSDLDEDLEAGFINISQEDMGKYNLDVADLKGHNSQAYFTAELIRIKQCYDASDECLDKVSEENPNASQTLLLFKKVAHSWLVQVKEKYELPEDD